MKKFLYVFYSVIVIVMFLAIASGFIYGDFFKEGAELIKMPWGIISLIDVYSGFIIFSSWVIYREKSLLISFIWILFIMILGNLITPLYVISALIQSKGDKNIFFNGKK